ncbi:hypothetical protein [Paraburkholderia youngii]|uniref:Uncharacterized protein n=1 Tax=Paraburkholderia youngii TaxID=2782701 RepID=A0A7Y6JZ53_9BURK|nr:hypothetical protein [Paraburkholderia youngii]NUY00876.1 hypothetical protein [Paraburkholderia youngii]
MLSPHEYATLVLVRNAPAQIDRERCEFKTLLEQRLIDLEWDGENGGLPVLTEQGKTLLETYDGLFANPA